MAFGLAVCASQCGLLHTTQHTLLVVKGSASSICYCGSTTTRETTSSNCHGCRSNCPGGERVPLAASTYLDLFRQQGFSRQSLLQGSLSRLAPVLMTSLTTGLGLLPLVIGGQQPGKEMLFPVATVILGGIITSTTCEFLLRPGMFWYLTPKRSLAPRFKS
jgi:hypothetical protein